MRLFVAGLRKLVRRPATWVTFLLVVGLLALIFLAVGATFGRTGDPEADLAARLLLTFPAAYAAVLATLFSFGSLFALLYGAAIAGSEWSWGTLKNAIARGESRTLYTLAGFAAVLVMVVVGIVLGFVLGTVFAALGAALAGIPLDGLGDTSQLGRLPEQLGRGALALGMSAALGYAVATVAKSQLAGIAIGIGLYIGEPIARIFLSDILQYFPFAAAGALISGIGDAGFGGGGGLAGLDTEAAILVVLGWLLAALGVAALVTERAEIGG